MAGYNQSDRRYSERITPRNGQRASLGGSRSTSYITASEGHPRHLSASIDPALDPNYTSDVSPIHDLHLDHAPALSANRRQNQVYTTIPDLDRFSPGIGDPSLRPDQFPQHPMSRFLYNERGPWNPHLASSGDVRQAPMFPEQATDPRGHLSIPGGPISPYAYREQAYSERDSSIAGRSNHERAPSDSGYISKSQAGKSEQSAEHVVSNQYYSPLDTDVSRMHLQPQSNPDCFVLETQGSHAAASTFEENLSRIPNSSSSVCGECGHTSKNLSDLKKHELRHTRPFVCDIKSCSRKEGFSTKNDLDRHKKSVHQIVINSSTDRSFRCAAKNCPKKEKVWPRLDNFRQHCIRIHLDQDPEELIRKSELDIGVDSQVNRIGSSVGQQAMPLGGGTDQFGAGFINLRDTQKGWLPSPGSRHYIQDDVFLQQSEAHGHQVSQYSEHIPESTEKSLQDNFDIIDPNITQDNHIRGLPTYTSGIEQARIQLPTAIRSEGQFDGHEVIAKEQDHSGVAVISRTSAASLTTKFEVVSKLESEVQGATPKEIENLRTRVVSLLNNIDATRKDDAEEATSPPNPEFKRKQLPCERCKKTMGRHCDLKKHMKRHERPWGCTITTCTRTFGSKNDWKRHENSQHYQLETYRCHQPSSGSKINQCAKNFFRRELFQNHLRDSHHIKDEEYIRDQSKKVRIGRHGQSGFWCGFCRGIVKLERRGLEAWDERFDHIDNEHFKKGERIENWLPVDKDVTKGLLMSQNVLDSGGLGAGHGEDESDDECEAEGFDNSSPATQERPLHSPTPSSASKHALEPDTESLGPRKKVTRKSWYCCRCGDGPYRDAILASCMKGCEHTRCAGCTVEGGRDVR